MPIKVVAFDLWNTLVSGTPPDIIGEIAVKLGFDSTTEFWSYCDKHYFNDDVTRTELISKIIEDRKIKIEPEKLVSLWESGWDSINVYPDVKPLLKKLREKYKTVLISNTGSEEGKRILQVFGLDKYFDYIIMSYDVGLAKPEPMIFRLVLNKFSVKPEEVVYIGDGFKNDFLGSKNVGFNSFLIDRIDKHPEYKNEEWYIKSLENLENKLN